MTAPSLTLEAVKQQARTKVSRVSDFLTNDEQENRIKSKATAKRRERRFDGIDAYCAEIIARFGYDAYMAWNSGEIDEAFMARMIFAERARDKKRILPLEMIILGGVAGANQPTKSKQAPKSLKTAIKVLTKEQEEANG